MPRQISELPKPAVHLSTGINGNVYSVIGACRRPARDAGWTPEEWDAFESDLINSANYDTVLRKILAAFEVS